MTCRRWLALSIRRRTARLAAVAVVALIAVPAAAKANGPCGQDSTGNTACPLAFPSSSAGSLTTSNESDYYVFSAHAGQEIFATITDSESPSCNSCGFAEAALYDAQGNEIYSAQTGESQPNNGITVPRSFGWTVEQSGTYYVIVDGGLGRDGNSNPTSVPYTLNVSAQQSPCGYSFPTAGCAINSPASPSGTLATRNQADYYAMYVQPNTQLSVTVTDNESPTCNGCGFAEAGLYDAAGNEIYSAQTGESQPNNGITVPKSFSYTVATRGVYFIEVDGGLGRDANDNPTQVPYTLQVSASPSVTWPAPTTPPVAKPPTKPARRPARLLLGAVRHSGHTVRLNVTLAKGAGRLTATATSGRRHRVVHVIRDGKTYKLSVRLSRGTWTIRVHLAGAAGWLTGTLSVRVHIR